MLSAELAGGRCGRASMVSDGRFPSIFSTIRLRGSLNFMVRDTMVQNSNWPTPTISPCLLIGDVNVAIKQRALGDESQRGSGLGTEFYGRSLSSYSSGTSSCETSCVRTSPSSASGAFSTPLTIPASNAWPSSNNSSALSESAPSTTETPPKSPPPAPAAVVRARRFNGTVSTLWLPNTNTPCLSRTGRLRAAVLRAALRAVFFFGAAFLPVAFAVIFFAPRFVFFCFAFFAMWVTLRRLPSLSPPVASVIHSAAGAKHISCQVLERWARISRILAYVWGHACRPCLLQRAGGLKCDIWSSLSYVVWQ